MLTFVFCRANICATGCINKTAFAMPTHKFGKMPCFLHIAVVCSEKLLHAIYFFFSRIAGCKETIAIVKTLVTFN